MFKSAISTIFSPFRSSPGLAEASPDAMDSLNPAELNGASSVAKPIVPKKKRGRPPKNANAVKSAENGTSALNSDAVVPSNQSNGNGPLVTSPVISNSASKKSPAKVNGNAVSPAVPAKKRGRPPKSATVIKPADPVEAENGSIDDVPAVISAAQFYRSDETAVTSTVGQDEVTDPEESDGEPQSHSPKKRGRPANTPKKRGRPPKKATAAQSKEPAKKRGRPKKVVDTTDNTDTVVEHADAATGDTVAPVKRGRGRPKKVQEA